MQLMVQNNCVGLQVNIRKLKSGRCCFRNWMKKKNMMAYGLCIYLHLPKKQLREVLKNMYAALKSKDGFIPLSNTENLKANETEDILPILRQIHLKISYMTCMALK